MLGLDTPLDRDALVTRVQDLSPRISILGELFSRDLEPVQARQGPLTDDRAPVEWLTDRMIIEHISRGGELDEDLLPTKP